MFVHGYPADQSNFLFSYITVGALQGIFFLKIRDYYGSGWVGPGLTQHFFGGKSSQNCPKPILIFFYSVYKITLLKVVGYYDLSVLSMM